MVRGLTVMFVLAALAWQTGCDKAPSEKKADTSKAVTASESSGDGWWCREHGIPEEECALCSVAVAADFKKKGDWCKEHNRPESQCFVCHPDLEGKFAARYEAKYGKQPPPREED